MNGNYDKDIVDLTTAQKVTNDHLDKLDEVVDDLDRAIRGDYQNEKDSLFYRLKEVEAFTKEFRQVFFEDRAGNPGYKTKIDAIFSGKMDMAERRKGMVSIIIAIITSTALVLTNLDRIAEFWLRMFPNRQDPLEKMIDKADHPHVKKYRVRHVIVQPEEDQE